MQTLAIKVNAKKEAALFNIYFSLREIYNNKKIKSKITMTLRVRKIAHVNLLACVPAHARVAIVAL